MSRTKEILTAVGTLACALGIGFVMQSSEAAEKRYGTADSQTQQTAPEEMDQKHMGVSSGFLNVQEITLTSAEFDTKIDLPSTDSEVTKVSAPQSMQPAPDVPQAAIVPGCEIAADARPIAAAMVNLTMQASCLPNERVTVHHNGMIFTKVTSSTGEIDMTVPALAQDAVFIIAFSNGEGAVAQTNVEELGSFDRVVLQWKGKTGFQIHAREFGADYGAAGHIWEGHPGEISSAVTGESGFITRLGDADTPDALLAEVYSFPIDAAAQEGDIELSVETEVSDVNCGLEIEAQSLEIRDAGRIKTQNLTLAVPDCDAVGSFLVLNNLLQDLKVARN